MKRDMRWYMDTAKVALGLKSDIKLAKALDMTGISRWCDPHKPVIPEISVMLKLAKLCNIPAEIALLDRAEMEANNKAPESVVIFQNIKKALKTLPHIAAMLLVLIALTGAFITFDGGSSAQASTLTRNTVGPRIYIMEHLYPVSTVYAALSF